MFSRAASWRSATAAARRRLRWRSPPRPRAARAHLGRDRADRDGRAAVRRQPDLRRLRRRHDARRRRRDARLADLPPAMLAFLSRKNWLEKGRMPFIAKRRHASKGESRVWGAILTRVLKRPLVSTVIAGGLLVALCIPALGIQFKNPGFDGYSRSQPVIQTHDRLQAAFPGGAVPAMTVIKADDVTAAPVRRRSSSCTTGRWRPASSPSPRASRSAPTRPSPSSPWRSRAAAPTPRPSARSRCCAPRSSGHGRQAARRRGRGDRRDGRLEGLHRRHGLSRPARVRLRAQPRVHPAAGDVPLDRRADQGDRPQPAVGQRRLGILEARLPGRPRREAARLHVGRRHRPRGSRCSCS